MQYTAGDALKLFSFNSVLNGVELKPSVSGVSLDGFPTKKNISAQV